LPATSPTPRAAISRWLNSVADRRDLDPRHNAGIIRRGTVTAAGTRQDWDATLAVNLDRPYNMVTAFLDQLRESALGLALRSPIRGADEQENTPASPGRGDGTSLLFRCK
jgi:NAD(P)-dependent dehydrogenase (short-subunit alcohol dehydrogenase family)